MPSPTSNIEVLTRVFLKAVDQGVETDIVRVADYKVHPDVSSE
jgi:multimeric flavodoxin WrbA